MQPYAAVIRFHYQTTYGNFILIIYTKIIILKVSNWEEQSDICDLSKLQQKGKQSSNVPEILNN